jgi:ribosomal protein L28
LESACVQCHPIAGSKYLVGNVVSHAGTRSVRRSDSTRE